MSHQSKQNHKASETLDHASRHAFRHESGLLVASLSKRVGLEYLSQVEDAVQDAMEAALASWPINGEPEKPNAWLYQVAYRKLISNLRQAKRRQALLTQEALVIESLHNEMEEGDLVNGKLPPLSNEMQDDMLALLFVTCDQAIPQTSQLVFTLKSLCGFSIKEIAQRLFMTQANVYKRFERAKQALKTADLDSAKLTNAELNKRLPSVYNVLYLIFTEGYLSSHPDNAIRIDLCEEAIHLASVLSQHAIGDKAETFALLALMYFHLARMAGRQAPCGALVLLAEQDRSRWHQGHIKTAMNYLLTSAQGEQVSRYHLEASIACEHCLAPSIKGTNWQNIIDTYAKLERIAPSPLLGLNRAIAISHLEGPNAALAMLAKLPKPDWFNTSYHYYAVKADLLFQARETEIAKNEAQKAVEQAPSKQVKDLLRRRFSRYSE